MTDNKLSPELLALLQKVADIEKNYAKQAQREGSNFNVFEVIGLTSDEVRLHSKFVAELLNPLGSHGQDDTFLILFIQELKNKNSERKDSKNKESELENFDTATAKVYVEKYIGAVTETTGGRIDIYLEDGKGNSITIENKIYAGDQPNQLLRYYNYKSNNIYYLTLYGARPSEISLGGETFDFEVISYKNEIFNWLSACRKEAVDKPILREGITHYMNLILHLTGQSNNRTMNDEIRDHIASSTELLKSAALIEENYVRAKIKLQWVFWLRLKEVFRENDFFKENGFKISEGDVTWKNVEGYYTKSRNRDNYYGFWIKIFEKDEVSVDYGVELGNALYCGFSLVSTRGKGHSDDPNYEKYRLFVTELDSRYTSNRWWLGWKFTDTPLNFLTFNTEEVFNLADREVMDKMVEAIVTNALDEIKAFRAEFLQKP